VPWAGFHFTTDDFASVIEEVTERSSPFQFEFVVRGKCQEEKIVPSG